jgi:hypothetical protein
MPSVQTTESCNIGAKVLTKDPHAEAFSFGV